jgi:hypothetical protein
MTNPTAPPSSPSSLRRTYGGGRRTHCRGVRCRTPSDELGPQIPNQQVLHVEEVKVNPLVGLLPRYDVATALPARLCGTMVNPCDSDKLLAPWTSSLPAIGSYTINGRGRTRFWLPYQRSCGAGPRPWWPAMNPPHPAPLRDSYKAVGTLVYIQREGFQVRTTRRTNPPELAHLSDGVCYARLGLNPR